jgi:hypothetical protein
MKLRNKGQNACPTRPARRVPVAACQATGSSPPGAMSVGIRAVATSTQPHGTSRASRLAARKLAVAAGPWRRQGCIVVHHRGLVPNRVPLPSCEPVADRGYCRRGVCSAQGAACLAHAQSNRRCARRVLDAEAANALHRGTRTVPPALQPVQRAEVRRPDLAPLSRGVVGRPIVAAASTWVAEVSASALKKAIPGLEPCGQNVETARLPGRQPDLCGS